MKTISYINTHDSIEENGADLYIFKENTNTPHTKIDMKTLASTKYTTPVGYDYSESFMFTNPNGTMLLNDSKSTIIPNSGLFQCKEVNGGIHIYYRTPTIIDNVVYVAATYRIDNTCNIEIGGSSHFGNMSDSFKVTEFFFKNGVLYGFVNMDYIYSFDPITNHVVYNHDGDIYLDKTILCKNCSIKVYHLNGEFRYWVSKGNTTKVINLNTNKYVVLKGEMNPIQEGNVVVDLNSYSIYTISGILLKEGKHLMSLRNNISHFSCGWAIIEKGSTKTLLNVQTGIRHILSYDDDYNFVYNNGVCYLVTRIQNKLGYCVSQLQ